MEDIAIRFDNVGKMYRLGQIGTGTISHDINRWFKTKILGQEDPYLKIGEVNDRTKKGTSDVVWALKDITFDVKKGEVVGIIGKNGAGKSTLLKLLSGITSPTTGSISYKGRIASLLEVGTGFHQELTGRENIYMNGSIMGMTRGEIDKKLDEIVEFAGVERYLDTPTKRYSSGMIVRLGFAVAAFLEPEILVVDEVLAVGDAEFQRKAIGKMQDVASGNGRTVLFVSHNMAAVRNLCKSGVVLNNGQVAFTGSAEDAISYYVATNVAKGRIADNIVSLKGGITIDSIEINGSESSQVEIPSTAQYIDLRVRGSVTEEKCLNPVLTIKTKANVPMVTFSPNQATGVTNRFAPGPFEIHERIKLPVLLSEGVYSCDIFLFHNQVEMFMRCPDCAELSFQGHTYDYGEVFHLGYNGFAGLERYE